MAEAGLLGQLGGLDRALDHRVHGDVARVERVLALGVGVHHPGEQVLIEAPPVDADAHRLAVVDRDPDDRAEVLVVVLAAHVARVDAVLGERAGAVGILGQQHVAVVVEVADHRHGHLLDDRGDRPRRRLGVHGDAHQLAARRVERVDLGHRPGHVGGVGVGHGLDDDRPGAAHLDPTHVHRDRLAALRRAHLGPHHSTVTPGV